DWNVSSATPDRSGRPAVSPTVRVLTTRVITTGDEFRPSRVSTYRTYYKISDRFKGGTAMDLPPVVSPQEWDAARQELLVKEKELTRARDALSAQRRRMPRMAVDKDYLFNGPSGPATLRDMFDGRRQLIVYRFFFQPDVDGWP